MAMNVDMTIKTPSIKFDEGNGTLEVCGRSLPENASEFYSKLFKEIEVFQNKPTPVTKVNLSLEYFNTSTSRILLDIIKSFAKLHRESKTKLEVKWFYEKDDWDMEDAGNEYKSILADLNFDVVEIERFPHRDLAPEI